MSSSDRVAPKPRAFLRRVLPLPRAAAVEQIVPPTRQSTIRSLEVNSKRFTVPIEIDVDIGASHTIAAPDWRVGEVNTREIDCVIPAMRVSGMPRWHLFRANAHPVYCSFRSSPQLGHVDFTIALPDFGPLVGWQFEPAKIVGALFHTSQDPSHPIEYPYRRPAVHLGTQDSFAASRRLLANLLPMLLPPALPQSGVDTHLAMRFPHPLYAFQRDGVEFLLRNKDGALLADDMGLGKTVQAIVALRMMFRQGSTRRALVVAPAAVITTWLRHFQEWAPELNVVGMLDAAGVRARRWREFEDLHFHVAVVSYDRHANDAQGGIIPEVDVLIADEVQKIKNPSTKRSAAMMGQASRVRWALSGTPLENSIEEFSTVLRFCNPNSSHNEVSQSSIQLAAKHLMLRRKKEEVLSQLPDIVSHVEYVRLTGQQRRVYDEAADSARLRLSREGRSMTRVRAHIQELKQICNGANGSSAKIEWLKEHMATVNDHGDKLLVFSQYLNAIADVESALSDYHPLRYTGSTTARERDAIVDAFQKDHRNRVMVLQVIAGSTGVTLHAANRVVHFDSWWNPAVQSQATARAHRIGQEKTVFETTLVAVDTVEERIQALLAHKRQLFKEVVDDLSVEGLERALSVDEMYSLFDL